MKTPIPDDQYTDWLREKRAEQAPEGFSDAVMDALAQEPAMPSPRARLESFAFWAKVALFTLAAVVGVSRYAILIFCLFLT